MGIHTTLFTDGVQHDTHGTPGLCLQGHGPGLDLLPDPRLGQPDRWMLLLLRHRHVLGQMAQCPCAAGRGPLVEGTASLPAALGGVPLNHGAENTKWERKKREEWREQKRRKPRKCQAGRGLFKVWSPHQIGKQDIAFPSRAVSPHPS